MKVFTIMCESFNRYDAADESLPGFSQFDFNSTPATCTWMSYHLMQTDKKLQVAESGLNRWTPDNRPDEYIAKYAKTRIIGQNWESTLAPTWLDAKIPIDNANQSPGGIEPDCPPFEVLIDFLKNEFYQSDYQHLIYKTYIGHSNKRVGRENRGIPRSMRKTFGYWMKVVRESVLPRIRLDETVVLLHNDHGSVQKGRKYDEAMYDGFLWIRDPLDRVHWTENRDVHWMDIRQTLIRLMDIRDKIKFDEGMPLI